MSRRPRIVIAIVAAAMLLFSQLAVSAYACPMSTPAHASAQPDCDGAMGNANLCEKHCDYGSASFEPAKPLQASPVGLPACLRVTLADVSAFAIAAPSPRTAPGPAPPSPFQRFTVLRI